MTKKLWLIVAGAIALRFILSAFSYHSDMDVFDLAGKLVAEGNILNIYDFTSASAVLNYPPLIYLYHGFFKIMFGFSPHPIFLKVPYLLFDLLIAFLLFKLSGKKVLAVILWLFNPVALYATYMMGQYDIIPSFFILLCLFLVIKNKLNWAAFALGLGIAFKLSPVFLIIPLILFGKGFWGKLKIFILSITPYLLSVIPYLPSQSFKATALFANQSSKSLYAAIPVSGGEAILLFPLSLALFYFWIWYRRNNFTTSDAAKLFLTPLSLFFIWTHYHPQWLIWIIPLLILTLISSGFKSFIPYLLIIFSWIASLFFFDPSLTVGIFSPVIQIGQGAQSFWELIGINVDYNLSRSVVQTIFAASAFFIIYELFHKRNHV